MKRVHRYEIPIADEFEIQLPAGFEIIHVGTGPGAVPSFWAIVDPARPAVTARFMLVGPGHVMETAIGKHMGTFVRGGFVGHLFSAA